MLITENFLNLDDYTFHNSPSSSSDGISMNNDYLDNPSDEDFLQQLSSDLDIPLLLNPGEDELSVLNSFLDQSPEEILSEVKTFLSNTNVQNESKESEQVPPWNLDNLVNLSSQSKSLCQNEKLTGNVAIPMGIKNEHILETPPTSPECQQVFVQEKLEKKLNNNVNLKRAIKLESKNQSSMKSIQSDQKVSCKRQVTFTERSRTNSSSLNNKVLIIPSSNNTNLTTVPTYHTIQSEIGPKVIVIDNRQSNSTPTTTVAVTPINTYNSCLSVSSLQTTVPLIIKTETETTPIPINVSPSLDPKVLKKQQRMIKNRESACLSRKKKKDYLTSLEKKVQELTVENDQLKSENAKLKDQLSKFLPTSTQTKTLTKVVSLCAVVCLMFFNVDYLRLPHLNRKLNMNPPDELSVLQAHVGRRNLLWSSISMDNSDNNVTDNKAANMSHLMCPVYINQTENVRLALELQRWIGKPYNLNNSTTTKNIANATKRDERLLRRTRRLKNKPKVVDTNYEPSLYKMKKRRNPLTPNSNEIQVFTPTADQLYSDFFEAINRQEDTFYLVSFSPHHMLLPALNYNKTRRPKMSLILPSLLNDDSSKLPVIPLMQIDCEVLDTQIIYVKNGTIPRHLRAFNTTSSSVPQRSSNTTENFNVEKNYKPYFMRKSYLKSVKNNEEQESSEYGGN